MGWVKIDDHLGDHPKFMSISDRALRVWLEAICWAARYETDGIVPRAVARQWPKKAIADLVRAKLWIPGDDAYTIKDYLQYNPSHAELEERRAIAARRAAMNSDPQLARIVKERDKGHCRYCGQRVNWRDRKSPSGGTYDHVLPLSQGGTEAPQNLVTACRRCNMRKSARTPEEAEMALLPPGTTLKSRANLDDIQTESGRDEELTQTTPTPTRTPKPKDSKTTEEFNDFYSAYPRKVQRGRAERAFRKALQRAPAETIIEGAHRLAADPNLPEKEFIPYPEKWLNGDGWEDEPQPPRGTSQSRHTADRIMRWALKGGGDEPGRSSRLGEQAIRELPGPSDS